METTFFAPAGRADEHQLFQQSNAVAQAAFIAAVLQAVPDFMLVLNKERQIVAANKRLLNAFGVADQSVLVGLRPGATGDLKEPFSWLLGFVSSSAHPFSS